MARAIRAAFPRCRTAQIYLKDRILINALDIPSMTQGHAPLLTHIFLDPIAAVALTSQFLCGNCSNLRSLVIPCLDEFNNPPAMPNLEVLEVGTDWIITSGDMICLLNFFRRTPALRDISLVRKETLALTDLINADRLLEQPVIRLNHLQCLHLHDHVHHVSVFLRLLPQPQNRLNVRTNWNMSLNETPLLGHAHVEHILQSVSRFWTSTTGEDQLPGGAMSPFRDAKRGSLSFESHNSNPGSPSVSLYTSCWIHTGHPILQQVTELRLGGNLLSSRWEDTPSAAESYLPNMQRLTISSIKTMKYLQMASKWIEERAKTHRPLKLLRVGRIGTMKPEKVEEVFGRLRKAGAVETIVIDQRDP
jgi:hypothetical protein